MSDGKIYIIVTDKYPGGQPGPGPSPMPTPEQSTVTETNNESLLQKYAFHKTFDFLEAQAQKAINYTISNIGNFTGDYDKQRQVQSSVTAIKTLMNIGTAAYAGFVATGNPIGAAIGAVIATGSLLINAAYEQHSLEIQQKKNDYAIAQLQQRSGLNTLIDGSRGTEN